MNQIINETISYLEDISTSMYNDYTQSLYIAEDNEEFINYATKIKTLVDIINSIKKIRDEGLSINPVTYLKEARNKVEIDMIFENNKTYKRRASSIVEVIDELIFHLEDAQFNRKEELLPWEIA